MRPRGRSRRCRLAVGGVLGVGCAAAVAIYATASPVLEDADLEEARLSKSYERQMEVFGGKAALVGSQLDDWLASLWHGQRLAYTVAVLTALVALACWAWCVTPPGGARPDEPGDPD